MLITVILVAGIGWWFMQSGQRGAPPAPPQEPLIEQEDNALIDRTLSDREGDTAHLDPDAVAPVEVVVEEEPPYRVLGRSVEGREIEVYRFGNGSKKLMFVGALHGGYAWNTALLMYTLIDHLTAHPDLVPADLQVVVVPVANPDGLFRILGTSGRFSASDAPQFAYAHEVETDNHIVSGRNNSNNVDLNRNFDCPWDGAAVWRENQVNPGSAPFSEPESQALRDLFLTEQPLAIVFYDSASNGVYASSCNGDPLPKTIALLGLYSDASGYPQYERYHHYRVTGDVADWLAKMGIPAITVELKTHDVIEWEKNRPAFERMLTFYSEIE
jgi:hypothetical protein